MSALQALVDRVTDSCGEDGCEEPRAFQVLIGNRLDFACATHAVGPRITRRRSLTCPWWTSNGAKACTCGGCLPGGGMAKVRP